MTTENSIHKGKIAVLSIIAAYILFDCAVTALAAVNVGERMLAIGLMRIGITSALFYFYYNGYRRAKYVLTITLCLLIVFTVFGIIEDVSAWAMDDLILRLVFLTVFALTGWFVMFSDNVDLFLKDREETRKNMISLKSPAAILAIRLSAAASIAGFFILCGLLLIRADKQEQYRTITVELEKDLLHITEQFRMGMDAKTNTIAKDELIMIRKNMEFMDSQTGTRPFVVDYNSTIIAHYNPAFVGKKINGMTDMSGWGFAGELLKKREGTLTYSWKDKNGRPVRNFMVFRNIPELRYIATASVYLKETFFEIEFYKD